METTTETFEQRMEREGAERRARCDEFAIRMGKAFKLVGLETFGDKDDGDGFKDRLKASLKGTTHSAYLSASIDRYDHKGRICVALWYAGQVSHRDVWGYDPQHIEITLADTKTAEQIAADVKRRILPTLAESIQKADALLKKRTDYEDLTARNVKLLGGKVERHGYNGEVNKTVYFDAGSAHVSGDSVRLELHSVKATTAKAIIDLLKAAGEHP